MPSISVLFGGLIMGLVLGLASLDFLDSKSKNNLVGVILFLAMLGLATFAAIIIMRVFDVYPLSSIDRIGFMSALALTTVVARMVAK